MSHDRSRAVQAEDLVTVARKLDDAARLLKDVVRRLVIETHVRGATWDEIGAVFGVSRQAVHERFGPNSRALCRGDQRVPGVSHQ